MKLTKQTVYLSVKMEEDINTGVFVKYIHSGHKYPVKKQKAFVFTPEQLNEYTANVIKQALETATEKAKLQDKGGWNTDGTMYLSNMKLDKQSITNTAEETFKKFEV